MKKYATNIFPFQNILSVYITKLKQIKLKSKSKPRSPRNHGNYFAFDVTIAGKLEVNTKRFSKFIKESVLEKFNYRNLLHKAKR